VCRKRNIDDMSSKSTNLVSRYVFFGIITKQIYNFVGKSVQCYYAGGYWVTLVARGSHVFRPILARIYKNLWNQGRNWVTWRKPLVLGKNWVEWEPDCFRVQLRWNYSMNACPMLHGIESRSQKWNWKEVGVLHR
jgi:hypothetical protein